MQLSDAGMRVSVCVMRFSDWCVMGERRSEGELFKEQFKFV